MLGKQGIFIGWSNPCCYQARTNADFGSSRIKVVLIMNQVWEQHFLNFYAHDVNLYIYRAFCSLDYFNLQFFSSKGYVSTLLDKMSTYILLYFRSIDTLGTRSSGFLWLQQTDP